MSWTVYIWCIEDTAEHQSFFLTDLREIARATQSQALRYVVRYSSTHDRFGCYDIAVAGGRVEMQARAAHTNNESAFTTWLQSHGNTTGRQAIIFSAHSSGWDVGCHEFIEYLPVYAIRRAFDSATFRPDIIAFDGCYMSTLENAYELHDRASYMVACETTSPNLGMCGVPAAFRADDPRVAALELARLYIERNDQAWRQDNPAAYPTDCAVIDLAHVPGLLTHGTPARAAALVIPDNPEFPFYDIGPNAAVISHRFTEQQIHAPDQPRREYMSGLCACLAPHLYTDRSASYNMLRIIESSSRSPRADPGSPPQASGLRLS